MVKRIARSIEAMGARPTKSNLTFAGHKMKPSDRSRVQVRASYSAKDRADDNVELKHHVELYLFQFPSLIWIPEKRNEDHKRHASRTHTLDRGGSGWVFRIRQSFQHLLSKRSRICRDGGHQGYSGFRQKLRDRLHKHRALPYRRQRR